MNFKSIISAGLFSLFLLSTLSVSAQLEPNPVDFVDSRIGTANDGHNDIIFPQLFGSMTVFNPKHK